MSIRATATGAVIACVVCVGMAACASSPGQAGPGAQRGPQVIDIVAELSLFLPEGAVTVEMPGPARESVYVRNASLFLSAAQITGILPVLAGLKGTAQISEAAIKAAEKDIDGLLSDAQREEYRDFVASTVKGKPGSGGPAPGMGPGAGGPPGGMGPGAGSPPGGGQGGPGAGGGPAAPGGDPRQALDSLISALQSQLEKLGA